MLCSEPYSPCVYHFRLLCVTSSRVGMAFVFVFMMLCVLVGLG